MYSDGALGALRFMQKSNTKPANVENKVPKLHNGKDGM